MVTNSLRRRTDNGFHIVIILVIIAALAVVGLLIWAFFFNSKDAEQTGQGNSVVAWEFDGDNWKPQGTPPACEEPLVIQSPVDVDKVNSVLLPGQIRGGDFKPHGGLATDMQANNDMTVSVVRDSYLYRGSRYIEFGEVQYMFDFIDPCGVMFRLDHLATLSDEFQEYAERMPEARPDSSQTMNFDDHPWIDKGTVIATEVGIKETLNVGFDFGVYDLRKKNAASETEPYKSDQLRVGDKEQSFYALCWLNNLPEPDKTKVLSYPERDGARTGKSDYCTDWR